MQIAVAKTILEEIKPFRDLFLKENYFQFVYNKCHGAGWADVYRFTVDGAPAGYGSIWGKDKREDRDAIFEFYLLPPYRKLANAVFEEFCILSDAKFIECQTNDESLANILYEFTKNINAEAILFEDNRQTDLTIDGVSFQKKDEEYILETDGEIAATGGFVYNYNFPFIDMYYEVKEKFRRRGLATLFVQELKKEAYRMNRVPSARCNIHNFPSKATLLKAGLKVCGFIVTGEIKERITLPKQQ